MSEAVKISVVTRYLDAQSVPDQQQYVFAYTITIANHGQQPVRLMTRKWEIHDADGKTTHVSGEGVVGQQPWIEPGKAFTYTSGTVLATPLGSMQGHYGLIDEHGHATEVAIPAFRLALPNLLH